MRLREVDETWACIQSQSYTAATCPSCSLEPFCTLDASYVLCPACKVVSPLISEGSEDSDLQGGVGLGFSNVDLGSRVAE